MSTHENNCIQIDSVKKKKQSSDLEKNADGKSYHLTAKKKRLRLISKMSRFPTSASD